ncbi:MAG: Z1 domain-containing protein [Bacillota bacterium]
MTDENPIIIEPVLEEPFEGRWSPVVGTETLEFLQTVVHADSRNNVRDASISILAKCVPPNEIGQETGLVIGYVQSGKTISFETVAVLARDNKFQIIIVIAGKTNPLLGQSGARLSRDLGLDDPVRARRWIQFKNPIADEPTAQAIRDVLEDWADPSTHEIYKKTVLITVLKHHGRLRNLIDLFHSINIQEVPVLIIDDEADQASMNNEAAQGNESSTYRCLMDLKQALPCHNYLQYTATPQAPLLVSIIDSLSPNFVQVLDPGNDYVGGQEFFGGAPTYVRVIPDNDVPTNTNPLNTPPNSLLEALRFFMVGVTAGILESNNTGNRSMMVHPSNRTAPHEEFINWVHNIFNNWKQVLNLQDGDRDKQELIQEFREAYNNLADTVGENLPAFEELVPLFRVAFRNTRVIEVNARGNRRTPSIDWRSAYGWILVGGTAMDRGFTIEGLTVTYMPRGIGVGNADTVQQRGRFFGYKRPYLGYCRVYLEQGTLNAFQCYVQHEEDIRAQLKQFQSRGRPLNDWKRAFVLDYALRPCRNNVLEFDYIRGRFSDDWVAPSAVLASDVVIQSNRETVGEFIRGLTFINNEGHQDRTNIQRHQVCRNIPLRRAIEQLLIRLRITGTTDSQRNTGLLLQLSRALEANRDEVCTVYSMSSGARRRRGLDDNDQIAQLFQGEAPVEPRGHRGEVYPGDRAIREDAIVTIQIHQLDLTKDRDVIKEDVPVIAVWVPAQLACSWVSQDQPPQNR